MHESEAKNLQLMPKKVGLKNIESFRNVCINPLPKIGTRGYVRQKRSDYQNYISKYHDVWHKEILLEVKEYTRGINCPFHKKNQMILKPVDERLSCFLKAEYTIYFAAGHMIFVEAEKEGEVERDGKKTD